MVTLPPCALEQCGKDFRNFLRKPSPVYSHGHKTRKVRLVPAFTIQALQNNTKVIPPRKCNIYKPLPQKPTVFRRCYQRGEIPLSIEYTAHGKRINWKVPVEKLDYHHYLPMFFDGLAEFAYPYTFIVDHGIKDLIKKGAYKVLGVVPQLIIPIKKALSTKRPDVICHCLRCIQMLVTCSEKVGEALVPYYRQILPILNLFKTRTSNHEGIEPRSTNPESTSNENVQDLIEETLQILERYGGPDAFVNIKYMIPTYESCVLN